MRSQKQSVIKSNKKNPVTNSLKELQTIQGVGESLSRDLVDLGYRKVNDLKGKNPENIYQNLMELRCQHVDRCVLYVFRCAVYYASNSVHEPELLKWWNWKDSK